MTTAISTGLGLIADERQKQITECGYTLARDQSYTSHELLKGALFFCHPESLIDWPFLSERPDIESMEIIDRLVRAGAMIAAELDRLIAEKVAS